MAETLVYTPENQANNALPWMLAGQNNGLFGGTGGAAFLGGLLGGIFPNIFGWGNGWGGNGFGGGAAASLGAQATANNNTDLIMQAINGTDADVRQLATANNADFNAVKGEISALQSALATVGSQVGMSGLQVINAIQSGNASLASQLCQCCCENRLLTTQQGYEAQIRTLEQTNQLGSQADRNTNSIIGAINAQTVAMNDQFCAVKERELQNKIDSLTAANTTLKSQIDNANQTAAFAAMLAPINAKLVEIESKQLPTVPVQYPNIQAVNNTPYNGAMFPGYGYGYGVPGGSYWG